MGVDRLQVGAFDVQASYVADTPNPLVGQPIALELVIVAPADYTISLPDWSGVSQQQVEWLAVGELTQQPDGGQIIYRVPLTVIVWEVGTVVTPETYIGVQRVGESEASPLLVIPYTFTVQSVLTEDRTLRPGLDVVDMPYRPLQQVIVPLGAVVLLIAVGFSARWLWLRWKRVQDQRRTQGGHSLAQRLIRALRQVNARYSESRQREAIVGEYLRRYVGERFSVASDDMTTYELLVELKQHLNARTLTGLEALLEQADSAKFADDGVYTPGDGTLPAEATAWIQAVERQLGGNL
jgi:hypothetical protein